MISTFINLLNLFNNQINKLIELDEYINQLSKDDKIIITNFASHLNISETIAIKVLNTLCELKILSKISDMYICPKCKTPIRVLSIWDEGDDITCNICNSVHPNANECDTETIYTLYDKPVLKIFNANWLDKYEKDSNGNPLPRKAMIIGYNKSDVEQLVIEYYHYESDTIEVSSGIKVENKMLIRDYN